MTHLPPMLPSFLPSFLESPTMCVCPCHTLNGEAVHPRSECHCRSRPKPKAPAPPVELFELFGSDVIFFPKAPTDKPGHVEWRDAHVCKDCGNMVLLPYEHLKFHRRLQEAV